MAISFDKALGIHEQAVKVRAQRAQTLANNIANADTPGFKAKDVDFKAVLGKTEAMNLNMTATAKGHFNAGSDAIVSTKYRVPTQPSIDGNTVDDQVEIAKYTENSMQYLASLQFLSSRFKGLMTAIKGE